MRHVPGILAGGFIIPGNNGLPDLYINATDPADWTTMQIAARQPTSTAATDAAATNGQPVTQFTSASGVLEKLFSPDYLAMIGKGIAAKIAGILLGLAVVIFGLYYFTKD